MAGSNWRPSTDDLAGGDVDDLAGGGVDAGARGQRRRRAPAGNGGVGAREVGRRGTGRHLRAGGLRRGQGGDDEELDGEHDRQR
jgi:hypothetical protein